MHLREPRRVAVDAHRLGGDVDVEAVPALLDERLGASRRRARRASPSSTALAAQRDLAAA